jgi:tRNA G37 N-methylase TrmD
MVSIAASLSRDCHPAPFRHHIEQKIMYIIALGDFYTVTGEVAAIAGLTSRGRLTVAIINSPLSIYPQSLVSQRLTE